MQFITAADLQVTPPRSLNNKNIYAENIKSHIPIQNILVVPIITRIISSMVLMNIPIIIHLYVIIQKTQEFNQSTFCQDSLPISNINQRMMKRMHITTHRNHYIYTHVFISSLSSITKRIKYSKLKYYLS